MSFLFIIIILIFNVLNSEDYKTIEVKNRFLPQSSLEMPEMEKKQQVNDGYIDIKDIREFEENRNLKILLNDKDIKRSMEKISVKLSTDKQTNQALDFYKLAHENIQKQEYEIALYYYNNALEMLTNKDLNLKNNILFGRSVAFLMLQNHFDAINDLINILEKNSTYTKAWMNLFTILDKININTSYSIIQNLINKFPKNHLLKSKIGFIYINKNDEINALKTFKEALDLGSNAIWEIKSSYVFQIARLTEKLGLEKIKDKKTKEEGANMIKESIEYYKTLLKYETNKIRQRNLEKKIEKLEETIK